MSAYLILVVVILIIWGVTYDREDPMLPIILTLIVLAGFFSRADAAGIPPDAARYQRDLTRNARLVWGLDAPVATFAAQIHQESRWNPNARSRFAGGLAQFTPDTANWISGAYPQALGANQPYNPAWAIRALVTYDRRLYDRAQGHTACDRMIKALWGYNGGEGWVLRDQRKAAAAGADPKSWRQVEPHNAGRASAMFAENRGYPRAILVRWQPLYINAGWGFGVCV